MNKLLLTNVIWMGVLALSGCSNQMITDDPSEEATPVRANSQRTQPPPTPTTIPLSPTGASGATGTLPMCTIHQ